jgi:hypothetical protein
MEASGARLDQRRADLAHLHAAIRLLAPDADLATIRPERPSRKGHERFGRSELGRPMLEVPRDTPEPPTAGAVARAAMARRGLDPSDSVAPRRVEGMVGPAPRRREGKTVEASRQGAKGPWPRLADQNLRRSRGSLERGSSSPDSVMDLER